MSSYKVLFACCLALLLTVHPAAGQLLWDQTMGTKAFDETSAAFIPVPGGYLNVGQGAVDGTARQPNQMYLSKVDEAGKVVWQRGQLFFDFQFVYPLAAATDAAGQFYVAALASSNTPTSPPSVGLLVKYTATGDTIWTRRIITSGERSSLRRAVTTADGGVVVIGDQGTDSFIANYSSSGQVLWRRSYFFSTDHPGYLQQLAKLPTGFLVINSPDYGGIAPRYLVLDENGLFVAEKPAPDYYPYALQPDRAGNLLAAGSRLGKISPLGDSLWTRRYRLNGAALDIRFATQTPTGGRYLLACARGPFGNQDVALLLVDAAGTVLRDTLLYRPGAHELPTGAAFDAAGNYVIGGYATEGPIGGADQFIFKLRNWDRLLGTATSSSRPVKVAYRLYPNPASSDEVHIADSDGAAFTGNYELRNVTGQLVHRGRTTPKQLISLRGLPSGLYLVRLQAGQQWLPALCLSQL